MRNLSKKAFTLVELLIVIGIIGLLAVTVLLTLNPAEAQRKTRDAKRIKDVQTLQTIMEQLMTDETTTTLPNNVTSASAGATSADQPCGSNWLGIDVCSYVRTTPVDPLNNRQANCAGSTTNCLMVYEVDSSGSDYTIRTRLESESNATKLSSDGSANAYFEVYSGAIIAP